MNGCKPTPTLIQASTNILKPNKHNTDVLFQISQSEKGNIFQSLSKDQQIHWKFLSILSTFTEFHTAFTDSKIKCLQPQDYFHTHHTEKTHNIFTYLKNTSINWLRNQLQKIVPYTNKLTNTENQNPHSPTHTELLETAYWRKTNQTSLHLNSRISSTITNTLNYTAWVDSFSDQKRNFSSNNDTRIN